MTSPAAILFDLDGTLHDRSAGLSAFLHDQYRRFDLDRHGISLERWEYRFVELDANGRVWKDVVYRQLMHEFDLPLSGQVLLDDYIDGFSKHVVPMAHLEPVLHGLHRTGWRLGIVTNGRSSFQHRTIASLRIESLLDTIVVSEECGFWKPMPEIFHYALGQMGAGAENSWFIGDDPIADVAGATGAGLSALLFAPDDPSLPPHGIRDLAEIPQRVHGE